MKRTRLTDRTIPSYTRGEEIFNMVSHIVGGVFAVAALVACVCISAANANIWGIVSGAVYGASMVILYSVSSVYHGLTGKGMSKKVMQVIDHCAIFFLVAGTYTPIALCSLRPVYPVIGWVTFGIIWAIAILGITLNAIDLKKYRVFSMICHIGVSWGVIAAIIPLLGILPTGALIFLFGGGILYTLGAILYGLGKRHKFMHSVFHLFVIAGSILHFFCIVLYIL
jgi:hemolysin III